MIWLMLSEEALNGLGFVLRRESAKKNIKSKLNQYKLDKSVFNRRQ